MENLTAGYVATTLYARSLCIIMIRILHTILIIFLPMVVSSQPYDVVDKFHGDLKKVIQKEIGRDVYFFRRPVMYLPNTYSGWKYIFSFEDNVLTRRVNKSKGKLRADYLYTYDTLGQTIVKYDLWNCDINNNRGDYIKNEWLFHNDRNEVKEIKTSSYDSKTGSIIICALEKDFKYNQDNLIKTFKRSEYNMKGELTCSFYCTYDYDSLNRIESISISDSDSAGSGNIFTNWTFYYDKNYLRIDKLNKNGVIIHSDLFKLDKYRNWIKWFIINDQEKRKLKSKRTIRYK